MQNTSAIALDINLESLTDVTFIEYLEANDITFHLFTWNGPGGGNPEVKFFGTYEALKNFIYDQYTSGDEEQDDYVVSFIKPA